MGDFYTHAQIGQKIKEARLKNGLTQQDLGNALGVTKAAVARWENGVVKNIKRDKLQEIASILHMSPTTLIGIKTSDKDFSNAISVKASEVSNVAFERIKKHIEKAKAKKDCLLVCSDEFTASQFEQIKNFIQFIKGNK